MRYRFASPLICSLVTLLNDSLPCSSSASFFQDYTTGTHNELFSTLESRSTAYWDGFWEQQIRWFWNRGILPNLEFLFLYFLVVLANRMTLSEQVSSRLVQKKTFTKTISEFYVLTAARRIGLSEAATRGNVRIPVLSSIAVNAATWIWSIPLTAEMSPWWETLVSIQAVFWWRTVSGGLPLHTVCWHTRRLAIFNTKARNKANENIPMNRTWHTQHQTSAMSNHRCLTTLSWLVFPPYQK